jgi:putative membrane protein
MAASEHFEARNFSPSWRGFAVWGAVAAYLALVVLFAWNPTPFAQGLAAMGFASALAHCMLSYGWKNTLALLAICLVVTFTMENIGSSTGLIFGRYHFEVGAQLPHIGIISVIVGGVWFGMGYFAWIVAATLLGEADRNLNERFNVIALPLVAAFVMTQWDFVMDPPEATISKAWIWHDGGADFGVPLTNYLGWLLTSWIFLSTFCAVPRPAARRSIASARSRTAPGRHPVLRIFRPHPSDALVDGAGRRHRRCRGSSLAHPGFARKDGRGHAFHHVLHIDARDAAADATRWMIMTVARRRDSAVISRRDRQRV